MDGPDQGTAAGRGQLRAARADREHVIEVLKTAFVQERLDQDEFGTRVEQALTARTYAELAGLTADIPVGLASPGPPAAVAAGPTAGAPRKPAQIIARSALWSAICLLLAIILTMGGMWYFVSPLVVLAVGILGHGITEALDERRSRSASSLRARVRGSPAGR
jgi:DUF1707 SHOCT-like domain